MRSISTRLILLAGATVSALAIVAALAGHGTGATKSEGASAAADASALLDPRYVKASACGNPARGRNELFKPGVNMALAGEAAAGAEGGMPLIEGLGTRRFAISSGDATARRYFDQGMALAYGFNHRAAMLSFKEAQHHDPSCAMCYWGEALVLGPNINRPMQPEEVAPAFAAISQARALAEGVTARERALIEALATRYAADPEADRAALDQAFAEAMGEVAAAYPDDADIAVLYAEALMNLQPWDYWEADGVAPKGRAGEIVATLERVLKMDPNHPHAIHLYIHAVEASAAPERAEPYADRLAELIPAAGHLVHMPGHIYLRVGRYRDSLETNLAAIEADEALMAAIPDDDIYRYGYYPHNVHFVLTSAQMSGSAAEALEAAAKLDSVMSDAMARQWGWVQAIKTASFTAAARFADPEDVLVMAKPTDDFPFVQGFWHYARAMAHLRGGDLESARAEAAAIDRLRTEADHSMLIAQWVPAPDLLAIAGKVLEARVVRAEGDHDRAIALLEEAVALEDQIPYMEPPYWYYPVRQTLGATLLMAGRPDEAETVFEASLIDHPNNGWALFGLMKAQEAQGDHAAAKVTAELLEAAWFGDAASLDLASL